MAPRHMAPREFVIICGDDTAHGNNTFACPVEARHWADRLSCPGRHRIVREGVLVEVA